jgi:hypothetical protein
LKRLFKASAAVFAALALVIGSANIAQAVATRTLATGNVLYGLDGAGSGTYGTLHSIDPLTGATSVVGSRGGSGSYDFAYQSAFNPVDGQIYWSGAVTDGEHLWKTNPSTGAASLVAEFKENGTNTVINSLAIDASGNAYGFSNYKFYSINLATAALTLINGSMPKDSFYSFAYNPSDSKFYAMSIANTGGLFEVDVTNGTATQLIAMSNFPDLGAGTGANARRMYSMTFDKNGSMWGINQNGDVFSAVITGASAADFMTSVEVSGTPGSTATNSLAVTYPASSESEGGLANTGTQDGVQVALATGAALAIAIGATLTVYGRRRTR